MHQQERAKNCAASNEHSKHIVISWKTLTNGRRGAEYVSYECGRRQGTADTLRHCAILPGCGPDQQELRKMSLWRDGG